MERTSPEPSTAGRGWPQRLGAEVRERFPCENYPTWTRSAWSGPDTMGIGIARVVATAGYEVVMRDVERAYVDRGVDAIGSSLDRLAERDALAVDPDVIRDRITGTAELAALSDADLVVEAVVEDPSVKREMFADLEAVVDDEVVLAANTSTLSITKITRQRTGRRRRDPLRESRTSGERRQIAYAIHPRGRAPRHSRCISVEIRYLLERKVTAGDPGTKTGKGFYEYD